MKHTKTRHWGPRSVSFWVRWVLLELFGPASQDEDTDPIEQLKREYGRPTRGTAGNW